MTFKSMHDSVIILVTYYNDCKIGEMVTVACDGLILTNSSLTALWSPFSKIEVPGHTSFRSRSCELHKDQTYINSESIEDAL